MKKVELLVDFLIKELPKDLLLSLKTGARKQEFINNLTGTLNYNVNSARILSNELNIKENIYISEYILNVLLERLKTSSNL